MPDLASVDGGDGSSGITSSRATSTSADATSRSPMTGC